MNRKEYRMYKNLVEEEYHRQITQGEEVYKRRLNALDEVWQLSQDIRSTKESLVKPTQSQLVLQAIQKLGKEISQTNIKTYLKNNHTGTWINAPRISTLLRKLQRQGIIELVQQGAGSRPNIYRETPKFNEVPQQPS